MAKSRNKTSVFRGRKDAFKLNTHASALRRWQHLESFVPTALGRDNQLLLGKIKKLQAEGKDYMNLLPLTKTQRKERNRTTRGLNDHKLQDKLVKQNIGAGLIFGLVSRATTTVAP